MSGERAKVRELAEAREDGCRNIAIALTDRGSGEQTVQAGENACFRQSRSDKSAQLVLEGVVLRSDKTHIGMVAVARVGQFCKS